MSADTRALDALGPPPKSPPDTVESLRAERDEAMAADVRHLDWFIALADGMGCRPGATGREVLERALAARTALTLCHAVLEAQVTCVVCGGALLTPEAAPRCCAPRDEGAEARVDAYERTSQRLHAAALAAAGRALARPPEGDDPPADP